MKLIFKLLVGIAVAIAMPKAGAAATNLPPTQTTLAITTDQPPTVGVAANNPGSLATNENLEAKPPGDKFTNSVDMVLLKVNGFWAGKFDVTQKQYLAVMKSNPSEFVGANRPVDSVSYADAMEFCRRMTQMDVKKKKLPAGYFYTLPTEDEWTTLMADAPLSSAVTSLGTTRSGTSPVGTRPPNRLGLYDTRGNVSEFCLGDDSKPFRFLKGGSWHDFVDVNLRPEFRWYCKPDERQNTFGFRCILKKK